MNATLKAIFLPGSWEGAACQWAGEQNAVRPVQSRSAGRQQVERESPGVADRLAQETRRPCYRIPGSQRRERPAIGERMTWGGQEPAAVAQHEADHLMAPGGGGRGR